MLEILRSTVLNAVSSGAILSFLTALGRQMQKQRTFINRGELLCSAQGWRRSICRLACREDGSAKGVDSQVLIQGDHPAIR